MRWRWSGPLAAPRPTMGRAATAAAVAMVLAWGAVHAGAQDQGEAASHEIADGQGTLVQTMVPTGEALPEGWMLDSVTVERKRIEVRYRAEEGGDALVYTLVHPEAPADDAKGSERETERFKILVPKGPEGAPTAAIADAIETGVRGQEGEFEWKRIEPPSPEPDAVEEGSSEEGPEGEGSEDEGSADEGSAGDGGGCSCDVVR